MSYDLRKNGWARASRTDKGVHAAMNVIQAKFQLSDDYFKDLTEKDKEEGKSNLKHKIDREKIIKSIDAMTDPDIKPLGII